jgi:hypothetical protein
MKRISTRFVIGITISCLTLALITILTIGFALFLDPTKFNLQILVEGISRIVPNPDTKEIVALWLAIASLMLELGISVITVVNLKRLVIIKKLSHLLNIIAYSNLVKVRLVFAIATTVLLLFVILWSFPTSYVISLPNGIHQIINFIPGSAFVTAQRLLIIGFVTAILQLLITTIEILVHFRPELEP